MSMEHKFSWDKLGTESWEKFENDSLRKPESPWQKIWFALINVFLNQQAISIPSDAIYTNRRQFVSAFHTLCLNKSLKYI